MARASELLEKARAIYDAPGSPLPAAAGAAARGFTGGAEWMRLALGIARGSAGPSGRAAFGWLGARKYLAALAAATAVGGLAMWCPWTAVLVVPVFYAVEVQTAFLFPLALDGCCRPWRESRALVRECGGTLPAMAVVMPLAWEMVTGGFRGCGFVRSWGLGCLAVLLWYERLRRRRAWTDLESETALLSFAPNSVLLVRRESLRLGTRKFRLLFVSDLHLRRANARILLRNLDAVIADLAPELVVLGGDYADTEAGFAELLPHVADWAAGRPVMAISGNHDRWLCGVRERLCGVGAHWLPDAAFTLRAENREIIVVETAPARGAPGALPIVTVLHDPAEVTEAIAARSRVVLAGHLHGSQVVIRCHDDRLFPGAWFYRWNGLRFALGHCRMLVSRGIGDTLPLRWNCPREVILCEFEGAP